MYIVWFFQYIYDVCSDFNEDREEFWIPFCNAFCPTLREEHVKRRFGHSLKDLTITEFKRLIVETPGYQDNARLREICYSPRHNEDALEMF